MRKITVLLITILLVATCLRLVNIGEPLWADEAISVKQSQGNVFYTVKLLAQDVHTPFYHIVLNGWIHLTGSTEPWVVRSLSLLFSITAIYLAYRLCEDHYTGRVGLYAAAFMAANEALIHFGQEARPYSLLILLSILSTYTYLNLLDEATWANTSLYAAVNAALLYTHIFGVLLLVSHFAHYVLIRIQERILDWQETDTGVLLALVSTAALFSPWIPTLLSQISSNSLNWLPPVTPTHVFDMYTAVLGSPIALILLIAIAAATYIPIESWPETDIFFLWAFIPPAILLITSLLFRPAFLHRYLLLTLPGLFLYTANRLAKMKQPTRSLLAALFFLALLTGPLYSDTFERTP